MPWLFHVIVFTIVALIIYARHMKRVLAGHACILRSWWSGDLSTVDGPTRVFTFPFYRSRVRVNASLDCDVDGCDIAKWGLDLKDPSAGMSDQFPRHSCFSMPHIRFVRDDFGFAAGAHQVHIAAASDDDLRDMLSSRARVRDLVHDYVAYGRPPPTWLVVKTASQQQIDAGLVPCCLVCARRAAQSQPVIAKLLTASQGRSLRLGDAAIAALL
jgi:hypothetical protein